MHSKKDTLPLLPLRAVNESSLSSPLLSDEPGEEARSSFAQDAEEQVLSEDELELQDDEIEPLEVAEDDEALELWDGEIDLMEVQEDQPGSWEDELDPFEYRHLPTSVEAAPI